MVSSDEIRKEITGEYQNLEHEKEVWDLFFRRILEYRDKHDDVTVIADSTNVQNKYRKIYAEKVTGFDRKILIALKKPLEVILKQNKERNESKIVPEHIVRSMYESYEEPTDEIIDSFDEYVVIYKWFDSSKVKQSFHYKP